MTKTWYISPRGTRQEGGTQAKYPTIACLTAAAVLALLTFASWIGVGSRDRAYDLVESLSAPQATSLGARVTPSSDPSSSGSSLESLARTSTPTPAPPPTIALTAAATPLRLQPDDPVRVPQATVAEFLPTTTPPPTPNSTPQPSAAGEPMLARQLAALIDSARMAAGVPQLSSNVALTLATQEFAALHFLSTDPFQLDHHLDGGPLDRAQRKGYDGAVGETLVTGSPDAEQLMNAWLNSPAHKEILLSARYRDVGVGCHSGPYVDDDGRVLDIALCVALLGYR